MGTLAEAGESHVPRMRGQTAGIHLTVFNNLIEYISRFLIFMEPKAPSQHERISDFQENSVMNSAF